MNEANNSLITPEQYESLKRLTSIFMPHATRKIQELFKNKTHAKFVHYTSAESALRIIQSKRFWMRNTNCMSDYREVQHGYDIFRNFFSDESKGRPFAEALDACFPGAALEAIQLLDKYWKDVRYSTYIAAISEHDQT